MNVEVKGGSAAVRRLRLPRLVVSLVLFGQGYTTEVCAPFVTDTFALHHSIDRIYYFAQTSSCADIGQFRLK